MTVKRAKRRPGSRGAPAGPQNIYGRHAVEAVLGNPARTIQRLLATRNAAMRLQGSTSARGLTPEIVDGQELDRRLGANTIHQGMLVETLPLPTPDAGILGHARLIIALDQITDPQNVGAVLRSAAAFGADALVMTERHSPRLDGALAKAASGALEHVPVLTVPNLARVLGELHDLAVTRLGLEADGPDRLETIEASPPVALVLGREDKGLRRLTREHCDRICRLRTPGPLKSLNVSNAAAVALHVITSAQTWQAPSANVAD